MQRLIDLLLFAVLAPEPELRHEVTEAELEEARAADAREEAKRERENKDANDDRRNPQWSSAPFDNPGWFQAAPGVGSLSLFAPRSRFGWSAKIGGGRFLAFKKTLLGLGGSFRLHVPRDSFAIVQVRPAIDIRFGPDFGRSHAYIGMSHGLAVEVHDVGGRGAGDGAALGSYSPGWMVGFAVLAWRGLFIGAELDLFLHDVRHAASGGFGPDDPIVFASKAAGTLSLDITIGARLMK